MTKLDDAIVERIKFVNLEEGRPASYNDFKDLEIEGKPCKIEYNTLRNKVSILRKKGVIERYYNSKASFFVIKGIRFGKQRIHELELNKLSDAIGSLPENNRGLHNIHFKLVIQDMWKILSSSGKFKANQKSYDILLPSFDFDGMKVKTSVHRTDTVTVSVACSNNPIHVSSIEDADGVIRLAKALAKTEVWISRILDEAGQSMPGGYERIPVPDSDIWVVTMLHFAVDSPSYREEKTCMTWKDGQGVLLREYTKRRNTVRRERQEYPESQLREVRKSVVI